MANPQRLRAITDEVNELHPLLKDLFPKLPRITSVEYTHGASEFGADFLLTRTDDVLLTDEYIAVIVKAARITQSHDDVERQVRECFLVPRELHRGKRRATVDEVWVLTSNTITKNAKEKLHHTFLGHSIKFYDGLSLEQLLDNYLPDFWHDLPFDITEYLQTLRLRNADAEGALSIIPIANPPYIEPDLVRKTSAPTRLRQTRQTNIELTDIVNEGQVVLVEGGMGSGKSKLIRRLIDHYANPSAFSEHQLLPVVLTYKELVDEYACDVDKAIKAATKTFRSFSGCYLLLIDAIDEKDLPVDQHISNLRALVAKVADRADIRVILTSRFLDWLEGESISGLRRLELRPLTFRKTLMLIEAFFKELKIAARIIEDVKRSQLFNDLPKSPIAAILLAKLLSENSKDLPSNMTELYAKYAELMLGRWDIQKGLQSQKEYQALSSLLMDLSQYMIENELVTLAISEVEARFDTYLQQRNLEVARNTMLKKLIERTDLVFCQSGATLGFKHRTFAEFFYAQSLIRNPAPEVGTRVFTAYWRNVYFFFLGLRKDDEMTIRRIRELLPEDEGQRWMKVINSADYLLAAYATPYEEITATIRGVFLDAAGILEDLLDGRSESPFIYLTPMQILYFLQYLMRNAYGYKFFARALEDAALEVHAMRESHQRCYALYLLDAAHLDAGDGTFDFLLKDGAGDLPLIITLAMHHSLDGIKEKAALYKQLDRRIRKLAKNSKRLQQEIDNLHNLPVRTLQQIE